MKAPVRIGPDCWLGTKVTVLRGTDRRPRLRARGERRGARRRAADVGRRRGAGAGAQGPRRGRTRRAATRAALADIARKTAAAAREAAGRGGD